MRFTDAQCGFKAVTREAAALLLPQIRDDGWFFDTELLVLAGRNGLRTHEVPVDWVDDPDSRVDIVRTAVDDLKGVARLAFATPIARFVAVGIASTVAYALLFILIREAGIGAGVGQRGRARADRRRQHRGQPPADVRRAWVAGACSSSTRRASRCSCSRSA